MAHDLVQPGPRAYEIVEEVERPERLDRGEKPLALLFTAENLRRYPHRDPERLRAAWEDSETLAEAADELGCGHTTVSDWLAVFGMREPSDQAALKQHLLNADPSDLDLGGGGEPA